ncbi:MAG: NADH-quinone oxidoreductase subunit J [Bacteroidota bacterium]|nr:NADH-quinone oxidoreductase subunit J [Bacteroidota bacterium]MDP4232947.1 NADH-quinone oxidoreductase subunit J [Bacteroidota bacterium]MDP4241991.1 NADH-quinone oxidoreductase subunit J [Bacteroidota bacterium]MDP4286894.1 NADH-quinone oxidoreductase subunit J [Bacteroidota bacterium]
MPGLFDIFFYLFAIAIVTSAVLVAFSRNIVHAAFSLLFTFFGIAGIYVILSADFIAIAQLLIYVGGILVLLVFGVMLTNRVSNIDIRAAVRSRIPALILCGALLFLIASLTISGHWIRYDQPPWNRSPWSHDAVQQVTSQVQGTPREILDKNGSEGTASEIGKLAMTDYVLPFELVSVVLLVALIGAATIARQDKSVSSTIPRKETA